MRVFINANFVGQIKIDSQLYYCNYDTFLVSEFSGLEIELKPFTYLPFNCKIYTAESKIKCDSPYVKLTYIKDSDWLLSFKFEHLNTQKVAQKSLKIGQNECKIETFYNNFYLINLYYNGNLIFSKSIKRQIENLSLEKIKLKNLNYFFFSANAGDEKYVILLNENGTLSYESFVSEIDYSGDKLKLLQKMNDCIGHGLATVISADNGAEQKDEFGVYIHKKINVKKIFVPYLFVECVCAKNYKQARKYLSKELSTLLNDNKLNQFFLNAKRIEQFKYSEFLDINKIAAFSSDNELLSIYKFELCDGLIENIEMY